MSRFFRPGNPIPYDGRVSPEQVAELESRFSRTFPVDYRAFLIDYPFAKDQRELTANPQTLAAENQPPQSALAYGLKWSDRLWWVGDDGCGGFYFIDCAEEPTRIYYWDHESGPPDLEEREDLSPRSIEEAVADIRQLIADLAENRQRRLHQIANRRWWQFWVPKRPPTGC